MRRRAVLQLAALSIAGCTHAPLATPVTTSSHEKTNMRTRPLMKLTLKTAPTQDIGPRVTFPITGGAFEGERLRGRTGP